MTKRRTSSKPMSRWAQLAVVAVATGVVVAPLTAWAGHSFMDVGDSNTFHADIEWLRESGVTKGCNPPENTEFCPEDFVTRGQMSAFLRRLAENQVVDADTARTAVAATDATMLDGKTVAELVPRAASAFDSNTPDGADVSLRAEIVAPAAGVLVVTGGIGAFNETDVDQLGCSLEVDNEEVLGSFRSIDLNGDDGVNTSQDCSTNGSLVVGPGEYSVDFEVTAVGATTEFTDTSIWVVWIPTP